MANMETTRIVFTETQPELRVTREGRMHYLTRTFAGEHRAYASKVGSGETALEDADTVMAIVPGECVAVYGTSRNGSPRVGDTVVAVVTVPAFAVRASVAAGKDGSRWRLEA
jgi:hypothetical protein